MNPIFILGSIWPTTVEGWVNLIVFIAGFVGAVAVLIPTVIKLCEKGAELMKNKNWSKIEDIALAAMKEAEASGKKGSEKQQMVIDAVVAGCKEAEASGKKGSEKQQMVIDAVVAGCKEAEIEISEEDLKNLAKYIDETIEWFNNMNKSSKKEETPKAKSTKRARKFLVTEEEEKKINKEE